MTTARAPGRVNLIGDHTDYQDGFCLPMAIDREVRVTFATNGDGRVRMRSGDFSGEVDLAADGSADPATVGPEWGRTVAAAARVLRDRGRAPMGIDADTASTVPIGAGLSSSAAFGVACTVALAHAAGFAITGTDLARAAQEAEHIASGVPCGMMDQMASVHGRDGHALLLDCRSLTTEAIPLPRDVHVLVVHSGITRRLENSAYAHRRAACEAAAARLGVPTLRDAHPADVASDPFARHVVHENARVLAFADALRAGDLMSCGTLMLESHASLRDDFGVSTPELDALVGRCVSAGAYGARLTGAGFGGCVVALFPAGRGDEVGGWKVHAAAGAGIID